MKLMTNASCSLTEAEIHFSFYTFKGQCLGMGDNLRQSLQMKNSGIA